MTPEEAAQLKNGELIFLNNFPVKFTKTNNTVIIHFDDGCHEISHGFAHCQYFSKEEYVPVLKYSSSRPFRKGDVATLVERNGRCPYSYLKHTKLFVRISEDSNGMVGLHKKGDNELIKIHYSNLDLVTPVEELEPYGIFEDERMGSWVITKEGLTYAYYPFRCCDSDNIVNNKEEARELAEAERDRLNAEHRKGMKK